MVQKRKKLNPTAQLMAEKVALMRHYPDGCFTKNLQNSFVWEIDIIPTPLSNKYKVRITYSLGAVPKVFVLDPDPLELYPGKKSLPHVYSTKSQRLCLYYPGVKEWTIQKLIAKTIVPWTAEWLQFYELWLATGEWFGEGIHSDPHSKKDNVVEDYIKL